MYTCACIYMYTSCIKCMTTLVFQVLGVVHCLLPNMVRYLRQEQKLGPRGITLASRGLPSVRTRLEYAWTMESGLELNPHAMVQYSVLFIFTGLSHTCIYIILSPVCFSMHTNIFTGLSQCLSAQYIVYTCIYIRSYNVPKSFMIFISYIIII